ncbi:Immune inhibitor A peptidase M6 [Thermomonospora echinospora]|uniref:Zinc carboxypeptidase n=1 Tax=Thermomonospora echinospora TaxID=1992 RepID=A0A1H6E838_9ACTN|nr:M14 family metallopeptidase [Thermomonospora echinospora]SEG93106.1 Immune inhibitor A peptidase M6 [Thermomonospora echinospora]
MMRRHFRKRTPLSMVAVAALLTGALAATPAQASPKPADAALQRVDVYTGDLGNEQLKALQTAGIDHADVVVTKGARGNARDARIRVELTITGVQARELAKRGVKLTLKKIEGKTAAQRSAAAQEKVFRPYSGEGNIREELLQVAKDHPDIAKTVDIGRSLQGKPITAVRVSKGVAKLKDRQRPAVVYQATQHAREWITPEMVRRLLHHYVDGYGTNAELTRIVDTTDLWFVPVVNVDGYDHTFTDDNRLWRKNLRDNDGDGQITGQDGVDLNRNFPYKWGYDNEGSSDVRTSETYRGASPGSEPETQAQIKLYERVRPTYAINWHSAAQLLLYGVGWQALTPSPDDLIHTAIVGDTDNPAVPGYIPQLGAQLYTTNGETDGHMENSFGTLTQTPEMSTCDSAASSDPDDAWEPEDCGSVFEFPDDETLIKTEVEKNYRYAIDVAKSAHAPDRPYSPVGRTVPDFAVDEFGTSYGSSQTAASVIRRSLRDKRMHYRINGGKARSTDVQEWKGGERFGRDGTHYFAEYRGKVKGQKPGDKVEVWFSGVRSGKGGGQVASKHFTYTVRSDQGAEVLVIADEDYKGVNPTYPAGTNTPRYAQQYVDAIKANKIKSVVWDIDRDGVPHDLGVLGHFDAVVWYLGDNRLTQDAVDDPVNSVVGPFPDSQVADRAKDLVLNVRSYLNEGGKLLHTGETTSYFGPLRGANGGGIYYGLKGHPEQPCFLSSSFRDDCELLSDDFVQYYLGAYDRAVVGAPTGFTGEGRPYDGRDAGLAGTATNPLNEVGGFQVTSTVLPSDEFPQFRSWKGGDYVGAAGPYEPIEGQWYVAGTHQDALYRRLTRTIDLTSVTAAQAPTLQAQLTFSTETGYDHVIVEARTEGGDDWTTLADKNGRTSSALPAECSAGFLLAMHPHLRHYITGGNPCSATGSSGSWNSFTGESGGWIPGAFDLSAYAGKKVEVSIAYVTDPFTGGTGVFIDDTRVTTTGGELDAEGFESGLGPWAINGAPEGSPGNASEFVRSQALIDSVSAVVTRDTVLLGFGVEQAATQADRNLLVGRALRYLLG